MSAPGRLGVVIFVDSNFKGVSQTLDDGRYDAGALQIGGDTVSSLRVPAGWTATLYADPGFTGRSKTFVGDAAYVGDDFNDAASSIIVTAAPPPWTLPDLSLVGSVVMPTAGGHFVTAGSDRTLRTDYTMTASDWERFHLVDDGKGKVALRTFFGTWVSAREDATCAVVDALGDWERFEWHPVAGTDQVALRTAHGNWLSTAQPNLAQVTRFGPEARVTIRRAPMTYTHVATVSHAGTLLAFALDAHRRLVYASLQPDGHVDDDAGWSETPRELELPTELGYVGFAAGEQVSAPVVRRDPADEHRDHAVAEPAGTVLDPKEVDGFLSSTARLTAAAPFQVLSDGSFLYLFRQSVAADHPSMFATHGDQPVPVADRTLLVDRFVMVAGKPGEEAVLVPKREIRFQRSRSKTRPQGAKDSLAPEDLDGNRFVEPTSALRFVGGLTEGRFDVQLAPTLVKERNRWLILAHDERTGLIDSYSVQQADDGLFDTRGDLALTCDVHPTEYALEPGPCPECGRPLVAVADRGGAAAAALDLAGDKAYVDLGAGLVMPPLWTVEAWLRPGATAPQHPLATLLGSTVAAAGAPPTLAIVDGTRLRVGWGDGVQFKSSTSAELLGGDPRAWHHVAVSFDGTSVRAYVDGHLRHLNGSLAGHATVPGAAVASLGAAQDGFRGVLDELRVWSLVRSESDVRTGMGQRLSGTEPELESYWRFDEARGEVTRNLCPGGPAGALVDCSWVTSDAPVAETAGITRSSFALEGHEVVTGLSALLYHQQENQTGGYDQTAKPAKQAARLMVAFGVRPVGVPFDQVSAGAGVAVLDLGVGGDGRPAHVAASLSLVAAGPPTASSTPLEQAMADLEAQEATASARRRDLAQALTDLATIPDTRLAALAGAVDTMTADQFGNQPVHLDNAEDQAVIAPADFPTFGDVQAVRKTIADLEAQRTSAKVTVWVDSSYRGDSDVYERLDVDFEANADGGRHLNRNDSASSIKVSAGVVCHVYANVVDDVDARAATATLTGDHNTLDGSLNDKISRLRLSMSDDWNLSHGIAVARLPMAQQSARVAALAGHRDALRQQRDGAEQRRAAATTALQAAEREIARLRVLLAGDHQVTMPLVAVDARGLTLTGAVCDFVTTVDRPELFESALGRISMYARGLDGTFLAAHYRTLTDRPLLSLAAQNGAVTLRAASPDLTALTASVADDPDGRADHCTLVITLPDPGGDTVETWRGMPRDPAALADVLNGVHSEPRFVGHPTSGKHVGTLRLQAGSLEPLAAGAQLAVGAVTRRVASAVPAGVTRIPLAEGPALSVAKATGTTRPAEVWVATTYDVGQATTTQIAVDLASGSQLVGAIANGATGPVETRASPPPVTGVLSAWTPVAPGLALDLDGAGLASAAAGEEWRFAAPADLTVEAWVRPDEQGSTGRIVQQRSTTSSPPGSTSVASSSRPGSYALGLDAFHVTAAVDGYAVRSRTTLTTGRWHHVAMTYDRAFAVRLPGGAAYLDCGASPALDLTGDLTLEATVALDDLTAPQVVLDRPGATGAASPVWELAVTSDGAVSLRYADADGQPVTAVSTGRLTTGAAHRIAVTRLADVTPNPDGTTSPKPAVTFYIDGSPAGTGGWTAPRAESSTQAVRIGAGLRGSIADVAAWTVARPAAALVPGAASTGTVGLVAHWRLDEPDGPVCDDSVGTNHARLRGAVQHVPNPDPTASRLRVIVDGDEVATDHRGAPHGILVVQGDPIVVTTPAQGQFSLGGIAGDAAATELLRAQLDDVRIWGVLRTPEEVRDNMNRRLVGLERADLLAYYTFSPAVGGWVNDDRTPDAGTVPRDPRALELRARTADGDQSARAGLSLSTVPIGEDAPEVRNALLDVLTDRQRVIAGSPSVAEYADQYVGAAGEPLAVFKRCYCALTEDGSWLRLTGYKVGDVDVEWVGQVQFDPQLMGFIEGAPPVPAENLVHADSYDDTSTVTLTEAESTTFTYSSERDHGFDQSLETFGGVKVNEQVYLGVGVVKESFWADSKVGIKGTEQTSSSWLDDATSGTGRSLSKVSTLGLRGRMRADGGYEPTNTGFALVQSETADVFALRLRHTGALIAYRMRANPDIPPDWNVITFQVDPRYTKQGTLDGKRGLKPDPDFPNALTYSPDASYFKPVEAYQLKQRIAREEQEARTHFESFRAGAIGRHTDKTTDLTTGDALGRLPAAEKRNLVNTYVWTAAGGQFAEEMQSLDSRSESTGGSYAFSGSVGVQAEVSTGSDIGISGELTALFGGHMNLTVKKAEDSSTSFGVSVEVTPEADLRPRGKQTPDAVSESGKVDAYRFMTFYLEPRVDHFDLFYNRIVDPDWLESSDPGAVALRGARQPKQKPPCWRVMHRVTFVSRVLPAPSARRPLETTMQQLDLRSNYELIRALDPYVRGAVGDPDTFTVAVTRAVSQHLPQLSEHLAEVLPFLLAYYEVGDVGRPLPVEDTSRLAKAAVVTSGTPAAVAVGADISLSTGLGQAQPAGSVLQWSLLSGPGTVAFAAQTQAATTARFDRAGEHVVRVEARVGGTLSAWEETLVTVG